MTALSKALRDVRKLRRLCILHDTAAAGYRAEKKFRDEEHCRHVAADRAALGVAERALLEAARRERAR